MPNRNSRNRNDLVMARDGHMRKLPDEKAGKERARHRAEAERPDLEAADPVARADHQEQRELRVADEELLQPGLA